MKKEYLGDAVYAEFDGWQIKLTTSNGLYNTNEIFLEPAVLRALLNYVRRICNEQRRALEENSPASSVPDNEGGEVD